MKEDIKKLKKKELIAEYQNICLMIDECAYGTSDLMYRDLLEREIYSRGYEIHNSVRVI